MYFVPITCVPLLSPGLSLPKNGYGHLDFDFQSGPGRGAHVSAPRRPKHPDAGCRGWTAWARLSRIPDPPSLGHNSQLQSNYMCSNCELIVAECLKCLVRLPNRIFERWEQVVLITLSPSSSSGFFGGLDRGLRGVGTGLEEDMFGKMSC